MKGREKKKQLKRNAKNDNNIPNLESNSVIR